MATVGWGRVGWQWGRHTPEEEHDRAWVVQLVHLVEVRHLRDVHKINDCKVFNLKVKIEKKSKITNESFILQKHIKNKNNHLRIIEQFPNSPAFSPIVLTQKIIQQAQDSEQFIGRLHLPLTFSEWQVTRICRKCPHVLLFTLI